MNLVFHESRSHPWSILLLGIITLALAACRPETQKSADPVDEPGVLVSVGSLKVDQKDLDHHLKENHGGRNDAETTSKALAELTRRAQFSQAARDAGLDRDPVVRAELARLFTNLYRKKFLDPRLKEIATQPIPEPRLRELYSENESRFRVNAKRQVAVLWLNPNGDAERTEQYEGKLNSAREWVFANDLKNHPEQGFSVLGVDHSEHQASRYKGGVVGWLESGGGMDRWTKAVAEIAFSLEQPGGVSQVISRPEGLFLVRLMAQKPEVLRPFESVIGELEQAERNRLRQETEARFLEDLAKKYPSRP